MTFLAQIILGMDSALPEDVAVNTLHFEIFGATPDEQIAIIDQVADGTGTVGPGVHESLTDLYTSLSSLLSSAVNPAGCRVKYIDLESPPPKYPIAERTMNIGSTSTTAAPSEIALVSSFQSPRISGVPQPSRRNRVFIGPLSGTAGGSTSRPITTTRVQIADAFEQLAATSSAVPEWEWVVYSTKLGVSSPISDGWVDNAFDTQRRRGVSATVRNTWTQSASPV